MRKGWLERNLLRLVKMEENAGQGIADSTVSQGGHVRSEGRKSIIEAKPVGPSQLLTSTHPTTNFQFEFSI
jgi:hypothetical protein